MRNVVIGCTLCLLLAALAGCTATSSNAQLFSEPTIQRTDIQLRRVAIVPNRLPLNLQDPEKWRRYNWNLVRREFQSRGIDVVDLDTSERVFREAGLPIEDTRSTRDKYAQLAEELGVDAIVIPYYGTLASAGGSIFSQRFAYTGVATFQIYWPRENQFFSRVDASGENSYRTLAMLGTLTMMLGSLIPSDVECFQFSCVDYNEELKDAFTLVGGVMALGGLVHDLWQARVGPDKRWELAFERGIQDGLRPFFLQYGR